MSIFKLPMRLNSAGAPNVRFGGFIASVGAVVAEFTAIEIIGGVKGCWVLELSQFSPTRDLAIVYKAATQLDGSTAALTIIDFDALRPLVSTARQGTLTANTIFPSAGYRHRASDSMIDPLFVAPDQVLVIGHRVANEAIIPSIKLAEFD